VGADGKRAWRHDVIPTQKINGKDTTFIPQEAGAPYQETEVHRDEVETEMARQAISHDEKVLAVAEAILAVATEMKEQRKEQQQPPPKNGKWFNPGWATIMLALLVYFFYTVTSYQHIKDVLDFTREEASVALQNERTLQAYVQNLTNAMKGVHLDVPDAPVLKIPKPAGSRQEDN
jgi:hypothetical protein